jgi:putative endonuclease
VNFIFLEKNARKREKYFKTTMGKKALKLMLRGTLMRMGYANIKGVIDLNSEITEPAS